MAKQIRLAIIENPDPKKRAIIEMKGSETVFLRGPDPSAPDLCCGNCGAPLTTGIPRTQISSLVIRCTRCGTYSDAANVNASAN